MGEYATGVQCKTCHHTQDGDYAPEGCNECHDIDGDADEVKAKKKYVHTKGLSWPKDPDQEQISCVSCHIAQNDMLEAGERSGKKAPVKCTQCHERNR
jgi:hypothetical protein